jgi:hypothetical protein
MGTAVASSSQPPLRPQPSLSQAVPDSTLPLNPATQPSPDETKSEPATVAKSEPKEVSVRLR